MAITLRTLKGSSLTFAEADTNFSSLIYTASQSGNNIAFLTTGSSVQAATTTLINVGLGFGTIANGIFSHAEGQTTVASGPYSHAEGGVTTASGVVSHAEGQTTIASGLASHAEGEHTLALGEGSHAEGYYTVSTGRFSHAEGTGSIASGIASHAEGDTNIASGIASHAEGASTIAQGDYSHAEGDTNIAQGYASHAEGGSTVSLVDFSHAEGGYTLAYQTGSHAEGYYSTASGFYAHSEGWGTVALGDYSHAQGKYNILSPIAGAFIHGNGTNSTNRSNLIFAHDSVVEITGSLAVTNIITGNLTGTASYAIGGGTTFPYTGSARITGSLGITGSVSVTSGTVNQGIYGGTYSDGLVTDYATGNGRISVGPSDSLTFYRGGVAATASISINSSGSLIASNGITGSLFGTASYAVQALSASYAPLSTNSLKAYSSSTAGFTYNVNATFSTGVSFPNGIIDIHARLVCTADNNGYVAGDVVSFLAGMYPIDNTRTAGQGITIQAVSNTGDVVYALSEAITVATKNVTMGTANTWFYPISSQWGIRFIIYYI